MRESKSPEEVAVFNERSFKTLLRAITLSQGQFALILVRCNYVGLQEQLWHRLQALCSVSLQELVLPQSVKTLFSTIKTAIATSPPSALMILGLESVTSIDQVLISTNQVREEFRTNFSFPLVLCVTEEILALLTRLAPDFRSWAATSIKFELTTDELLTLKREIADELFANLLDAGACKFLPNEALDLAPGCRKRQQLESIRRDLYSSDIGFNRVMEATWQFILGRDAYASDQIDAALDHYHQSFVFWQQESKTAEEQSSKGEGKSHSSCFQSLTSKSYLERQGVLLFHLGLCYCRKAERQPAENRSHWEAAKDFFFAGIKVFERQERPDLVAQLSTLAGQVLRHLKAWSDLQTLALQSLTRLETYNHPAQVAQAYGFLAEVALEQSKWTDAFEQAKTALSILTQPSGEAMWSKSGPIKHRGLYLLLLAKAELQMGQYFIAVNHLEEAKKESEPQYDPQLYLEILEELRWLYFEQGRYWDAFEIKQEQRSIRQQYRFSAFLGASPLRPQRQAINPALEPNYLGTGIAQEITAAGRHQDVQRLIERLSRNDYKLIVIHGASGVGKSSLINAGLVPALSGRIIGARQALPVVQHVYTDWVVTLGRALETALTAIRLPPGNDTQPINSLVTILEQLRINADRNLLTVIVFDQFEEFFFVGNSVEARQEFYNFFARCLNLPFVKVILSLREDDLHYLLECERRSNLDAINNNILDKQIRYSLGNFSLNNAKEVIKSLIERFNFHLEPALIDELVQDLAGELGEVRPIEMQVVGAQLQAKKIQTLEQYRQLGADPKASLVERSILEVIGDCGHQNEDAVWSVLFSLTDTRGIRPLKTQFELAAAAFGVTERRLSIRDDAIPISNPQLDLILNILVGSGLVSRIWEEPEDRYQLIHDYVVEPIRQQYNWRIQLNIASQLEKSEIQLLRVRQQRLRAIAVGVTMAILAIATGGFAWRSEVQRRLAATLSTNAELIALSASSEALFVSNKKFDALIEALRAGSLLKQETLKTNRENFCLPFQNCLWYSAIKPDTQLRVVTAYEQAVYNAIEQNSLQGHSDGILDVSISRNGQMIASGSRDTTVKLWRTDGTLLKSLVGHENSVTSVAFSPDAQLIASGSWDKTVKLWRTDGQLVKTFRGHTGHVYSVSFHPNGKIIASASGDGTVRLWTVEGGLIETLRGHKGLVLGVRFSPDGQTIASAGEDKTVRLWRRDSAIAGSYTAYKTLIGHNGKVNSISFSRDGSLIASGSDDKTVKLWSSEGSLLKTLIGHTKWVYSVSFSPDSQSLASASEDNTIRLWNRNGSLLKVLQGHGDRVNSVYFNPDGETIASASNDKTVKLWKPLGISRTTLKGYKDDLYDVSFSRDSKLIATASKDGIINLWSRAGTLLRTLKGHTDRVYSVSFSPELAGEEESSPLLVSGSRDKTIKLWNRSGKLIKTLIGHGDWVLDVDFSPDGQLIASASRDKTVRLWNRAGKLIKTLIGHGDRVNAVAFSPDGQLVASASDDKTVKIWKSDGTFLQTLVGHSGWALDVSWSQDAQLLASGSYDNTVKIWHRIPGKNVFESFTTLKGPTDSVAHVRFSPTGDVLATTSWDNRVQLWRLDDTLLKTLEGQKERVTSISFSPDGRMLASASNDKTVVLWNLDLDDLLRRSCSWLHDYLEKNPKVKDSDRFLCKDTGSAVNQAQ